MSARGIEARVEMPTASDPSCHALQGCPTIINAAGPLTRLSGAPLAPGVGAAMAQADAVSADLFEVQAFASRALATATGAEAGIVTSGAGAGLLLAAAACLARLDVARMNALPDCGDGPSEVIVARGHRNGYDHALRAAGARLVEVGMAEDHAGAGIRGTEAFDYAGAIGPATAGILYVAGGRGGPTLPAVAEVAREHGVPLVVDAAAELPPAANLTRFIAEGADLVVFSGGKILGGPAGTGILCGRRELIRSAALQVLDMDVAWSDWHPPADLFDRSALRGLPRQGIGRACKVGKNEVFGLLAALAHFRSEGDAARHGRWLAVCRQVAGALRPQVAATAATATIEGAEDVGRVPVLALICRDRSAADTWRTRLIARPRPVHTALDPARPERVIVNPVCLRPAELEPLVQALSGLES